MKRHIRFLVSLLMLFAISCSKTNPLESPPSFSESESSSITEPQMESGFLFDQGEERIQIGIYIEPGTQNNDAEHYDQIQQAGITYILMSNVEIFPNEQRTQKMLNLCAERGIAVLVNSNQLNTTLPNIARKAAETLVETHRAHPAFRGVLIKDEPFHTEIYADAYRSVTNAGYHAHINLFPHYMDGMQNYHGYVEDSIISLGIENMDYLQFDDYPYRVNHTTDLFYNMNIIREAGLKYGVNTAFFVQSTEIRDAYRFPSAGEVRRHVSIGLAYGFKNFTYYTWATVKDSTTSQTAILDRKGVPTALYQPVKEINAKVHGVGDILPKLDALKVTLTNGSAGGIETADPATAALHPQGDNAFVISYLEKRGGTQEYILLVNNNYDEDVTETFTISKNLTALTDCTNGTEVPVDISSTEITLTLKSGDFMLFKLGEGDDFVQVELDADEKNLAENKPVSVEKTYSNAFAAGGSFVSCLTDGQRKSIFNNAKGWHCKSHAAAIDIDLKRIVVSNRVDVYPYDIHSTATYAKRFPRDFDVQISTDGETWTTVASVVGFDETKDGIPSLKFDAVEARYVRINVTKGVGNAFEIAEIEVYHDDGTIPAVKEVPS